MKKTIFILIVATLLYPNISEADIFSINPPTIFSVKVVHPLDTPNKLGYVKIKFKWDKPVSFVSGHAFEIGLVIDPLNFAAPVGYSDKDATADYKFFKDGNSLQCGYRDVLNFSDADSVSEAGELIADYCGEDDADAVSLLVKLKLTSVKDELLNLSVGTYCPEIDIVQGATYEIIYFLVPSINSLVTYNQDNDEGYGTIVAQVFLDFCDMTTDCPYVMGIPKRWQEPALIGCGGESTIWHNRICVPTDWINLITLTNQDYTTGVCVDDDEDGLFAAQTDSNGNPIKMFGTAIGDCNDNKTSVDDTYYNPASGACPQKYINYLWDCNDNEWCDPTQGLCMKCENGCSGTTEDLCFMQCDCSTYPKIAELQSPADNETFWQGEEITFSFTPGNVYENHWVKFRRAPFDTGPTIASMLYAGETSFSSANNDFFDVPGEYRWVVYYYDECCELNDGDGNCYSEIRYFTIEEQNDCEYLDEADCGNCGTKTCLSSGVWGNCQNEGECSPGTTQNCTVGNVICTTECTWPECPDTNCTPNETASCGNCGTMTCSANGNWGTCQNEGECSPGTTQDCTVGSITCTDSCSWPACPEIDCTPNDEAECGNCGTMTCSNSGDWGDCLNEGECTANETETVTCNDTGSQSRTCDSDCNWGAWSDCSVSACECTESSAPCCDGCNYEPSTVICDSWSEFKCDSGDIYERIGNQYCSSFFPSENCSGTIGYMTWHLYEECAENETCELVNDNPTCVALSCECDNIYNPCCSSGCYFDPPTKVCQSFTQDTCSDNQTAIITNYIEKNCTGESKFCNGIPTVINTTIKKTCTNGTTCVLTGTFPNCE